MFRRILLIGSVGAILLVGVFSIWALTIEIPDFESFLQRKVVQSTKIYDKTGNVLLYDIHGLIKRTVVPFDQMPRHMKNATVAIEDNNFYNHYGISPMSILRAFIINLFAGEIRQGGSTITQQLVKNTLLTHERTLTRKIKELVLSLKVERRFSKDEILNFYLNEIPYGSANYGIEAASQTYFGKQAKDLSLSEIAYLAAIPKAPTFYSPYGNHRDLLEQRKNLVLGRMQILGFINEEEENGAREEVIQFISRGSEGLKAPHFVLFVRDYLTENYGEDMVERGGLKVITTLDWNLQQKAEILVKQFVEEEEEKFNVSNAGLVALDPKTGGVLVMVGSRDWFADSLPEGCTPGLNCAFEPKVNVVAYAKGRQPGSAFKPFVYATAFEKGYTDQTVIFDLPTEFNSSCDPDIEKQEKEKMKQEEQIDEEERPEDRCYHPKNYDNIFRGPVTFREALAQSINVPSVKVLYLAGVADSLNTAKSLGITTLDDDPNTYGLTLVLGGGEVRLLEMVGAYSVFANDGIRHPTTAIIRIEDAKGNVLEENKPLGERVLSEQVSRIINDVLSDNDARTPAFGARSYLYFPDRAVAVKTGTTNDYRDAWVIGYTPNFATGVWFGNNDNSSMEKRVAGFIAAPLWSAFLKETFKTLPKEEFVEPDDPNITKPVLSGEWRGSRAYLIDIISGKRATDFTPGEFTEQKVLKQIHSALFWLNKNDPRGSFPENPENDSQFNLWEFAVRKWTENQNIREETEADLPQEFDDVHTPENMPRVIFKTLPPQTLKENGRLEFSLDIQTKYPVKQIDVTLGARFLGTLHSPPYIFSYTMSDLGTSTPQEELTVTVYDNVGNKAVLKHYIRIQN